MASALSIDLASSQLPRGLTWHRCSLQTLVRVAAFCHNRTPKAPSLLPTSHTQEHCRVKVAQPLRSYGHSDPAGWAMVLVLNELLDVTAARQLRRRRSTLTVCSTDPTINAPRATRPRCINCQRRFSFVHDAVSRPQQGYCSADCRVSHEYMAAIDADLDGGMARSTVKKNSSCSTLDSTYSPVEPISHCALMAAEPVGARA